MLVNKSGRRLVIGRINVRNGESVPGIPLTASERKGIASFVKKGYFVETEAHSTEPVKVEPVKVEPAKAEPVKVEPAKVEPAKVEPVTVEPTELRVAEPEVAKTEISNFSFTNFEISNSSDTKDEPIQPEVAITEPLEVPVETEPKVQQDTLTTEVKPTRRSRRRRSKETV